MTDLQKNETPLESLFPLWTNEARAKWEGESESYSQAVRQRNERYLSEPPTPEPTEPESKLLRAIERLIQDPTTTPESRTRLVKAKEEALSVFSIGDKVRVEGCSDPLTIVDRTIYSPTGQFYSAIHSDPHWQPPTGFEVNRNYGMPRVCLSLSQMQKA